MTVGQRRSAVPAGALIRPTLMMTGRSAAGVYAQPAAELSRLAKAGAIVKLARGYFAAVPVDKRQMDWQPSMEAIAAGLATAVFGPDRAALWGLSAARVHGALPRAIATGFVLGPTQHRPIQLTARPGHVEFRQRDPQLFDVELFSTELGPGLVTSIEQTILDLSTRDVRDSDDMRAVVVRTLMARADQATLEGLAQRTRGQAALRRARKLAADDR
jgi:hypothetical protein